MSKHPFAKGLFVGAAAVAGLVAGAATAFTKVVLEPEEKEDERIEENRRRANRKSMHARQG